LARKKIQNLAGKKTRAKKVFWGPLKTKKQTNQKSKQTKKKQTNQKQQTNQKDLKQKSGEKHFICFSGAYLPRRFSAPLLFLARNQKTKKGAGAVPTRPYRKKPQ
jgi:hypothetical protein